MSNVRVYNDQNVKNIKNRGILDYIKNLCRHYRIGELLVLKGHISPYDLKSALRIQKETPQKPLGEILVEQAYITKNQLIRLLFRQKVVRFAVTSLVCLMSFTATAEKARAGAIKDVPARIALSQHANKAFQPVRHFPAIFGAKEKRSTNLKAFTKWADMFTRFDRALNRKSSDRIVQAIRTELAGYRSSSIYAMARDVNAMMNRQKYIVDSKNWGKSDYWATPIEFMTRGGDCEDFAIAKYVALRALGVPENRMRIAVVQDEQKNTPHAVLIVYSEKGAVVLDNQIKSVRSTTSIAHYKPIFSINREAWWLHTLPKAPATIIASAR